MITYFYWFVVLAFALGIGWLFNRYLSWKYAVGASALVVFVGWCAFYFEYEQLFVKKFGGVMSISVPQGQVHILATWKEDHLWIENYDPKTNTCYFNEYSKGHLLQGQVAIENCNPLLPNKISAP